MGLSGLLLPKDFEPKKEIWEGKGEIIH